MPAPLPDRSLSWRAGAILFLVILLWSWSLADDDPDEEHEWLPDDKLPDNYSQVSFSNTDCKWRNVGGQNSLKWTKRYFYYYNYYYMHLNMNNARDNLMGRLASPWLDSLENRHVCVLQFQYFIPGLSYSTKDCQLSLFRQTSSRPEERIWTTQNSTGWWTFSDPLTVPINCTGERFRMVFEGKGSCYEYWNNEIDVTGINMFVFKGQPKPSSMEPFPTMMPGMTINHTNTQAPGITVPGSNTEGEPQSAAIDGEDNTVIDGHSTIAPSLASLTDSDEESGANDRLVKDEGDKDDDDHTDLDSGALAGIIIAVIIVVGVFIAVVILVFVILRRRRLKDKSERVPADWKETLAVTNSAYEFDHTIKRADNIYANGSRPPGGASSAVDNPHHSQASHPLAPPPYSFAPQNATSYYNACGALLGPHNLSPPMPTSTPSSLTGGDDTANRLYQTIAAAAGEEGSDGSHDETCRVPVATPSRNIYDNPTEMTSARAGTSNYETIDDADLTSPPSKGDATDGTYNRLGMKAEGVVGENAYDYAKDDSYDALHGDNRKRRLQRELAHDDYSHI